jgi:branched-chain amino acid transport system substrate-binding protein
MKLKTLALALAAGLALQGGAVAAETLKIGVIAPLTGGGAPWGMAASESVKIAAAEANAAGGIKVGNKTYDVEVISYDDHYKAADAIAAYNRLVNQDSVKFVIVSTSPSTLALAPSLEADRVLMLTTAGVEKAVDPENRLQIRTISILRDYVPPTVAWVRQNMQAKTVVIVNPNDESGWYSTNVSQAAYKENGFDILGSEVFERTQKDFQPLMTKIVAMTPDIIELASCPPATAALIVRTARDLGFNGTFVKNAGAATKEILDAAGKEGAEGVISLHYADPTNEGYQRVAAEYKKRIGQMPDDLFVSTYDGVNLLLKAVAKAGTVDDAKAVSAAFPTVLPAKGLLGDELTMGGVDGKGQKNQVMTYSYISIMKDGTPQIVGKVK